MLAVAPPIGLVVVPLAPTYHWYLSGGVPDAVTLMIAMVCSAIVWLAGCTLIVGAVGAMTQATAVLAVTMPAPESRSNPGDWISTALLKSAALVWLAVGDGITDMTRAAMAAAWGAAADVPQNG